MRTIKEEVINIIAAQSGLPHEYVPSSLERPAKTELGDYSLTCFRLAKELEKPPQQLAAEIASKVKPQGIIEKVQATGGYVNIFLSPAKLTEIVLQQKIPATDIGKGKTIVIDYSSPNIAKPFGIGHLRSTVIGNALYKIYSTMGYKCIGINFLGDWGTQFGMLIADYKKNKDKYPSSLGGIESNFPAAFFAERYVDYNEKSKNNSTLLELAKSEFKKLEDGNKENIEIWQDFKKLSLSEFQRIYRSLGVTFDEYSGEANTNQYLARTITEIEKKGLAEISNGALAVKLDKYNMPPCLLRKSDGATLYAARDIAAAIHRYNAYKFHKLIYVVGSDQKLHFRQVFKVLELMGYPWAKDCIHVDFGLVRFKGEKMSTRRGTAILLEDVLNEAINRSETLMKNRSSELRDKVDESDVKNVAQAVGIGAIIFNDLKNKRIKDMDFDWEQVLTFDGETGPYLQYTHTRLAGVLEKYRQLNQNHESRAPNLALLSTPEEIALIKKLKDFAEIIEQSALEYEPSILSNHLLELASLFNHYYQIHRIITDNVELTRARIHLVGFLKDTIAQGLQLLGIKPLEKM